MENLKNIIQMNFFTEQKQTHRYRKQTDGYQRVSRGGLNWKIGIDVYILLYIKQITNKDLLYSTGNSTQYSVMAYMGKESKRGDIYAYITDAICCPPETITLLIGYTPSTKKV